MIDLGELKYRGTQVAYYVVCKRKLWLFSKGIGFEHSSEWVALGKLLDEESFKGEREEYFSGEPIKVDFIKGEDGLVVHEVKHSRAIEEAHEMQVLYYIYYLKRKGIKVSYGLLHYPKAKRVERVFLDLDKERLLEGALREIDSILSMEKPPAVEKKTYCKNCAYFDFCYG